MLPAQPSNGGCVTRSTTKGITLINDVKQKEGVFDSGPKLLAVAGFLVIMLLSALVVSMTLAVGLFGRR